MLKYLFLFLILLILQWDDLHAQEVTVLRGLLYTDARAVEIEIRDGIILRIRDLGEEEESPEVYIAPGLIDLQINGYFGVDFSGPDLKEGDLMKATQALWKVGVTTYFPTLITSDIQRLHENFAVLARAKDAPEIRAAIPGFHLEGPYISPLPGFRGAHLGKYIKEPDWKEFKQIQESANHQIKLITVAPERKGAIPFIENCVRNGVLVSIGHHNANPSEIQAAVDAGVRMATHLGNGCANEIHRHNNPIWPQLSQDLLSPTIIADGFHLTREEVRTFFKVKGVDKTILVSDALDLAGLEVGEYIRGERKLLLTPDVVKLPEENVLAGAASPISKCVGNMIRFTQCSLGEAIQMASTNPARMLSLQDRGEIKVGKRADLILFRMVDTEMDIRNTYVGGKLVYSQESDEE